MLTLTHIPYIILISMSTPTNAGHLIPGANACFLNNGQQLQFCYRQAFGSVRQYVKRYLMGHLFDGDAATHCPPGCSTILQIQDQAKFVVFFSVCMCP